MYRHPPAIGPANNNSEIPCVYSLHTRIFRRHRNAFQFFSSHFCYALMCYSSTFRSAMCCRCTNSPLFYLSRSPTHRHIELHIKNKGMARSRMHRCVCVAENIPSIVPHSYLSSTLTQTQPESKKLLVQFESGPVSVVNAFFFCFSRPISHLFDMMQSRSLCCELRDYLCPPLPI